MKRFFIFCIPVLIFCLKSVTGFAQDFETPGSYIDYINKQDESVVKKFLTYNSAASHGKRARKVEKLREKLLNEVQECRMNISSMPKFKGDGAYRDTVASFFKFYYNVLNDDYGKIVNMEDIAEQSYDEMEAYIMLKEQINIKLQQANDKFSEAQHKFAAKNNINLVESTNETGEKMKQVSAVNKYYGVIYLIFFKPYIEESYLLQAIGKNNINAIEQNKTALLKYAEEGLIKLNAVKDFNGDNNLKDACKQMLQFYIKEVNSNMKAVGEYFLTKESFEKINKAYEKSDHTKDDVNAYNKAVAEINAASDAYNRNNKNMNEGRSDALNNWNKAVDNFFDDQMPKYK